MKKLLVLALLTVGTSFASTIAMTTSGDDFAQLSTGITVGWSFTAANPIIVTSLGYYDEEGDGLNSDHEVGIFDTTGNLLVSVTVLNGTGGTLNNGFRMTSISPFALAPGDYVIGGFNDDDFESVLFNPSILAASGITINNAGLYASSFSVPNTNVGVTLGAVNFEFEETPEPSTMLLSLGAFAALGLKKRFSKRA